MAAKTTTHRQHIEDGINRLSSGSLYAALYHFLTASSDGEDASEQVEATQLAGVTFRKLGSLDKAAEYGELALTRARNTGDPGLVSEAARDLAATLHAQGVVVKGVRAAMLRSALYYYDISLEYNVTSRKHPFNKGEPYDAAWHVTSGMRAFLLFDMAHFRIWINDDGSEPGQLTRHEVSRAQFDALDAIENADYELREADAPVWELNNLLKLIQMSSFAERLALLRRAERLVAAFPNRKKQLWVAILGRGASRTALRIKAWQHRS